MAWDYKREEQKFEIIPEGNHRIRIASVEKAVSKTGKDMLAFQFDVSGYPSKLYHYIVAGTPYTNRNLTQFFDSFKGIADGDFSMDNWIGQVGACNVVHEEYNGEARPRIRYFIAANRQDSLPAWKEGKSAVGFAPVGDVDVPF